jgi:hypothetical protein
MGISRWFEAWYRGYRSMQHMNTWIHEYLNFNICRQIYNSICCMCILKIGCPSRLWKTGQLATKIYTLSGFETPTGEESYSQVRGMLRTEPPGQNQSVYAEFCGQ